MDFELTPARICLSLGAILFGVGFYFGVTDADKTFLCYLFLLLGVAVMIAGFVLIAKQEEEKKQRRLNSFMRSVELMPLENKKQPANQVTGTNASLAQGTVPLPQGVSVPQATQAPQVPVAQGTQVPVAQGIQVPVAQGTQVPVAQGTQVPVAQAPQTVNTVMPNLQQRMNTPSTPPAPVAKKSVPIQDLPSFDQEDWGVYEEKNV